MEQLLMIWSAVCSLPHSQSAEGTKPHLYIFVHTAKASVASPLKTATIKVVYTLALVSV